MFSTRSNDFTRRCNDSDYQLAAMLDLWISSLQESVEIEREVIRTNKGILTLQKGK